MNRLLLSTIVGLLSIATPWIAHTHAQSLDAPPQISVSGDARGLIAPDAARITASFEEQALTVTTANEAIQSRLNKVLNSLKSIAPKGVIVTERGSNISGVAEGSPIVAKSTVSILRTVAFETSELDRVGALADTIAATGASGILGIEYFVSDGSTARNYLVTQALDRAKLRAQLSASQLGVKLGKLLDTVVSEEPIEKIERTQETISYGYGDVEAQVSANLRFAVN